MTTLAQRVVAYAEAQRGKPYVWGAEGPNGFDCSGLVYAAYKAAGLPVSRTTAASLGRTGSAVPLSQAQPGDVLYFDNPGTTDHVAIYAGSGRMVEAPTQGVPVRDVPIRTPTSVRRLLPADVMNQSSATPSDWTGGFSTAGDLVTDAAGAVGDAVASLNPLDLFRNWQNDVTTLALKIVAGAAVVGITVVSIKTGINDRGAA